MPWNNPNGARVGRAGLGSAPGIQAAQKNSFKWPQLPATQALAATVVP